jgi:hypothetical protein
MKTPKDIREIIVHLATRQRRHALCPVGKERLKWWRKHWAGFTNAKDAVLSWDMPHIQAWMNDQHRYFPNDLSYDSSPIQFHSTYTDPMPKPGSYFSNWDPADPPADIKRLIDQIQELVQEKNDARTAPYKDAKMVWLRKRKVSFFGVKRTRTR